MTDGIQNKMKFKFGECTSELAICTVLVLNLCLSLTSLKVEISQNFSVKNLKSCSVILLAKPHRHDLRYVFVLANLH